MDLAQGTIRLEPWQERGYLLAKNGVLHIHNLDAVNELKKRGSPLLVFSEKILRANVEYFREAFSGLFSNLTICFAAKACSLIAVLKVFNDEGICIEVNSAGELQKALLAGFAGKDIVLNGVSKSNDEIDLALQNQIKAINVDSLFELQRIADIARSRQLRAHISLRAIPELESGTTPGTETASSATKFGMNLSDTRAAFAFIREQRHSLQLVGMHVHIGSQICNIESYAAAAEFLVAISTEAEAVVGEALQHVNIGGGYPVNYVKYQDDASPAYLHTGDTLDAIALKIAAPLHKKFGADIELIIEPGRRLVGAAAVTLATVENFKQRGEEKWLYIDAGYHTLLDSFSYKWYYHCINAARAEDRDTAAFRLVGPLCDNGDSFYDVDGETTLRRMLAAHPELKPYQEVLKKNMVHLPGYRELPAATATGDVLALLDTGAYSIEQIFAMNGRPRPEIIMIGANDEVKTIRHRDSFEDMLLNEVRV